MIAVVTPEEMAAIDRAAPEPVEVLIGRAGAAVARAALEMLGGGYGRRVVVIADEGSNQEPADEEHPATVLERLGVQVAVTSAQRAAPDTVRCGLVIGASATARGSWPAVPAARRRRDTPMAGDQQHPSEVSGS